MEDLETTYRNAVACYKQLEREYREILIPSARKARDSYDEYSKLCIFLSVVYAILSILCIVFLLFKCI